MRAAARGISGANVNVKAAGLGLGRDAMGNVRRSVVAVGSALALAGCWGVPGQNADRTGFNNVESAITPATVNRLVEAWTYHGGPFGQIVHPSMGDPVVSGTSVFAVTGGGFVQAGNAATGQSRRTAPAHNY